LHLCIVEARERPDPMKCQTNPKKKTNPEKPTDPVKDQIQTKEDQKTIR
jgi:hypothetical protein